MQLLSDNVSSLQRVLPADVSQGQQVGQNANISAPSILEPLCHYEVNGPRRGLSDGESLYNDQDFRLHTLQ